MSEAMGTREASELWGYSQATISEWCRKGMIEGVNQDKKGSPWHIPKNANCPKLLKTRKEKNK